MEIMALTKKFLACWLIVMMVGVLACDTNTTLTTDDEDEDLSESEASGYAYSSSDLVSQGRFLISSDSDMEDAWDDVFEDYAGQSLYIEFAQDSSFNILIYFNIYTGTSTEAESIYFANAQFSGPYDDIDDSYVFSIVGSGLSSSVSYQFALNEAGDTITLTQYSGSGSSSSTSGSSSGSGSGSNSNSGTDECSGGGFGNEGFGNTNCL